ncbi:cytochrome P450 [Corynespora cassiicola Philippines]|uniref:Cytochrome P450 n=1 Tax=Corynespora cassiicola Philippines TaxID=1448308 RepID=A0A2T2NBY9_CORCC|nr:cytochrome P450 [Corynespora cassiicola Philippines]
MTSLGVLSWPATVLLGTTAALTLFVAKFIRQRRQFKDLPKPPHHFLWGHLKLLGETMALFPGSVHFQYAITTLTQQYDLPGVWYQDLWPFGPVQLIVVDPDIALHVTGAHDHPKHYMEEVSIAPVGGVGNVVSANGPRWKYLHKMLAPAFGLTYVRNLVPLIADQVMIFRDILKTKAESGEKFRLEDLATNLTFDIMNTSTFGFPAKAQSEGSPTIKYFKELCKCVAIERDTWNPVAKYLARLRRWPLGKKLDGLIADLIRERWSVLVRDKVDVRDKRSLSILDMVLRDHLLETQKAGTTDLGDDFLQVAIVQVRILLFAGTGTTSDTICFIYMFLSEYPDVVRRLREEHDRVFTPDIDQTFSMLRDDTNKLNELKYTKNVIKETLRFYPIGNTARVGDETGFFEFRGKRYTTKDMMICPVQHAIHMNPKYFPHPNRFDPDRYTRDESPSHAWRPFERGPRACLGQPLAMDEMKTILLLTVRDFNFKLADIEPNKKPRTCWTDLDMTFGDRFFQEFAFEATPRDGMKMTVSMASG